MYCAGDPLADGTGSTLFGCTKATCSSKSCLSRSSETHFGKCLGQKYYGTSSGHCPSEDGACCTNFAKDKTGAIRGDCCLPKGLPCITGPPPCCTGIVGNVSMNGTCTIPAASTVGVCQ